MVGRRFHSGAVGTESKSRARGLMSIQGVVSRSFMLVIAHHDGVHAHPSDERRGGSFVNAICAFFTKCLHQAVQWTFELGLRRSLQTDLNSVKSSKDVSWLCDACEGLLTGVL